MQVRVKGRHQGIVYGRQGDPGYHSPGRTSGGYPYKGLITKLRHPLAQIPTSDIHESCLSCCGVASIPPVDPRVIVYEIMYSGNRPARAYTSGEEGAHLYMGSGGRHGVVQLLSLGGVGKL